MAYIQTPQQIRSIGLGILATKATGTLTNATTGLFTIAGGLVAVTSIVGRVTTAITVANTYKLQHHPTAGTTKDLCASADIGTTDTILGEVFVLTGLATDAIALGSKGTKAPFIILETGSIEQVSSGTDGAITWYVTWAPIDDAATLVAA
jgi:hypothetical protein